MKLRLATSDDSHDLARLNAKFNEVHVLPVQLSSRLENPHRVEMPIVVEVEIALSALQVCA